ncbi:MAG: hypothetical protein RL748_2727, partial [Pseudomonadota bacterium]
MLTLDFQCHYAGDTSLFDRFPSLKPVRLKLAVPIVSYQSDGSTGLQWVHHDAEPVSDTHLLDQASHQFHLPARTITGSNPGLFLRYFAERIAGLFLPQPYYDATIALPVPELVRQMSLRSVIEITTAQSKNHSQIRDFNLLPLLVTGDVVNPADDAAIATLNEYLTPLGRTRHADRKVANNVLLINADALQDLFRSGDPRSLLWVLLHGLNGKGQLLSLSDVQHRFDVLKTPNHEDDDIPSPQQKLEDAYEAVAANLSALLSWPLSFTPIPVLDVGGKFSIKSDKVLLPANFSSNALSLRFQSEVLVPGQFPGNSPGGVRSIETTVIEYDWQLTPAAIKDNTVSFAFDQEPLLAQHIISPVTVRVQGFDGVDLWQKEFDKDDPALAHLHIAVALYVPAALRKPTALQNERGIKLRGQVVDATSGKVVVKGLTVMLQAKLQKTDSAWLTVGAASTDGMGNFSMDYPLGVFVAAQALVSSSAVQSAPVPIQVKTDMDAVNKQKTLDEGFIFLVLQAGADENDSVGENCDCHHPRTAGRLPDHADLMASDEYSQDVGTGCITLTTPNRTLSEHAYLAIVRTSDPDVANYELKRETVLDGMQKNVIKFSLGNGNKIKRGNIDLFNPVRWQDDPSDPDPLSFYQSVTVAHGHVLRYKAVWKADGYSLGDLLYSLPLAPGQKKQIVINELSRSLAGGEQQQISQSESLAANLFSERTIVDTLAGSISENLRGNSSSSTGGVSVSAGASYLGMANIGVSGGYSKSDSDASQDSGRNIAQNFEEKIRHNTMQNAQSYRQNNAAVVTTVGENQKFSTQVEVVANHNHCHSMTMMYFEVLRHYAVFQELS